MFKLLSGTIKSGGEKEASFFRKWFAVSLVIHLIVAWFSVGFYYYDEHFQILEFAGFKIGHSPANELPWEYGAEIRSAFQPFIAFCILKFLAWFQVDDPLLASNVLRMMSAILGWLSSVFITATAFFYLPKIRLKYLLIGLTCILSSLYFIHARFSSEGCSGSFAFLGFGIILLEINRSRRNKPLASYLTFFISGFLLGLSFLCRVQAILLFPGFFLWMFFIAHVPIKKQIIMIGGLLLAISLGVLMDYWFYGKWVNTAFKYFWANIILGKASEFGTEPWWWYFKALFFNGFWAIQTAMILLVIICCIYYRRNPMVWICIPFLIAHFIISHKELRFLFPLIDLVPFFIILGANALLSLPLLKRIKESKLAKPGFYAFCAVFILINLISITGLSTKPPTPYIYPATFIYHNFKGSTYVIGNDSSISIMSKILHFNFYKNRQTKYLFISNTDSIKSFVKSHNNSTVLLMISSRGFGIDPGYRSLNNQLLPLYYQTPQWAKKYEFNNWTTRTSFWKVYQVLPAATDKESKNIKYPK